MNDQLTEQARNFRYERKFYLENTSPREIELFLKLHPFFFREIYHQRQINNIYLDSFDFRNYWESVNGVSHREKYRIRWYGDLIGHVSLPVFEIKLKRNHHIAKLAYPLESLRVDETLSIKDIRRIVRTSSIPHNVKFEINNLEIKLFNSYVRKYYLSEDGKFRVTVDSSMGAYKYSSGKSNLIRQLMVRDDTIVELKYSHSDDDIANVLTQDFPFRITRSSKYVQIVNASYC